jgi:phosphate-selective porin OprO and OprP
VRPRTSSAREFNSTDSQRVGNFPAHPAHISLDFQRLTVSASKSVRFPPGRGLFLSLRRSFAYGLFQQLADGPSMMLRTGRHDRRLPFGNIDRPALVLCFIFVVTAISVARADAADAPVSESNLPQRSPDDVFGPAQPRVIESAVATEPARFDQPEMRQTDFQVPEKFNAPPRLHSPPGTFFEGQRPDEFPLLPHMKRLVERSEFPTLQWSGFIQLDTGNVSQDETSKQDVGTIGAQTGLRRVRLRAQGRVREEIWYRVDLDFAASGHPSFRDVGFHLSDVPHLQNLQLGYFRQPFGMDAMSSGRELLFLERQLPFAFAPFRQTGIGAYGSSEDGMTAYALSFFIFPTNSFGVSTSGKGGGSFATRLTHLLIYRDEGRQVLHVGGGYSVGDPAGNTVRYKIQPGFFVVDPADPAATPTVPDIVDTGNIPSNLFHLLNLEFAAALGPLRIQSEGRVALVEQIGGPNLAFPGAYVQVGYLLTGENQHYDRHQSIFRGITPHREFNLGRGGGAWELAFGWSFIDLTDRNIDGGEAQSWEVGLNWYLSRYVKFAFNAGPVLVKDRAFGRSRAFVVGGRAQVAF